MLIFRASGAPGVDRPVGVFYDSEIKKKRLENTSLYLLQYNEIKWADIFRYQSCKGWGSTGFYFGAFFVYVIYM